MNILVPNLGSTSLKYRILEMPSEVELAAGKLERVRDYREAIGTIQTGSVQRGGVQGSPCWPRYRGTFLIDDGVMRALEEFLPAAPAHKHLSHRHPRLPGIDAGARRRWPHSRPNSSRDAGLGAGIRRAGGVARSRCGAPRISRGVARVHRRAAAAMLWSRCGW